LPALDRHQQHCLILRYLCRGGVWHLRRFPSLITEHAANCPLDVAFGHRQNVGPLVDLCLNVFSPSSGVSLHLRPLTLGSIGGLVSSLIGVLDGLSRLILCLIDALLELLTVLRGCRPRGRYDLLDLCLKEAAVGPAVS
jgi:hypothetical protein